MPYLKKARRKQIKQNRREERQNIYQSKKWKLLRLNYLVNHPLCELCLANGIITPAIDIHHKDSFLNYSGDKRIEMAYNSDNLIALCKQCHSWLHRNGTTHGLDITKEAQLIKQYEGIN